MKAAVFSFMTGIFFLASCTNTKIQQQEPEVKNEIELLFAGDIMAHTEITERNYDSILDDVEPLIKSADLAFANFESPVNDDSPQSTYPTFSCHSEYAEKIISYGFNVFSLANNHTNDFRLEGIKSTASFFNSKKADGIFSAGIKDFQKAPIKFITINKNGMKILFASVTEVLNLPTETDFFDYLPHDGHSRSKFLNQIESEKKESGCDMLILSFHTAEPEYVDSIAEKSKNFYYSLINSGVDILWINHPHVAKEWEVIHTRNGGNKIIFYSVGNTVSSQRRNPNFLNPESRRDFTGDSFLFSVKAWRTEDGIKVSAPHPSLITTVMTDENEFIVKKLDDDFIKKLKDEGNEKWASYLSERKKAMNKIKGKDTWQ